MCHYVYMLLVKNSKKKISYVGYAKDPNKRLIKHNSGLGAKFTRGRKWNIIYKKKLDNKNDALKYEYELKKNIKLRNSIKKKFINDQSSKR